MNLQFRHCRMLISDLSFRGVVPLTLSSGYPSSLRLFLGFVDNLLQTESTRAVSGMLPMENGHCLSYCGLPKYKQRRVSAVRDFPPGCGPFASWIFVPSEEVVCARTAGNSMQAESSDAIRDSSLAASGTRLEGLVVVSPRLGAQEINHVESNAEEQLHSFDLSNGIEPVNMGPQGTLLPDVVGALSDSGTAMPVKASEGETLHASKDFLKVDACCPLEEKVPRNYPVRRRISAVRVFPTFCGRNALLLVRGEDPSLPAFADARNIKNEKLCSEEKPWQESLREALDGDMKQLEDNFSDANAYNGKLQVIVSRLTGNRVLAEPDGPANKETRNQMESRAASINEEEAVQVDVRDQSDKYTRECIQNLSNLGSLAAGIGESKGKRSDFVLLSPSKSAFRRKKKREENFGGADANKNSTSSGWAYKSIGEMTALDSGKFKLFRRQRNVGVSLPLSNPSGSSAKGDARKKVREALRLFHDICRKLLQEDKSTAKGHGNTRRRYDLWAAKILKEKGKYVNTGKQIIGSVPGVEVGDEFQYRVELNIIGLHRPIQGGIDYLSRDGGSLATSIVASGGYDDDTDGTDVLIYMGQGGNMYDGGKEPEDQELTRGNRALKNSKDAKIPVRVIRGEMKVSDSLDLKAKTYVYDGLYLVEKVWQEKGPHGKLVYKFKLVRIPGQPELSCKVVKKSKKSKVHEGLCFDDISQGREPSAICAVNTIDDEKPPPFEYVPHMIYPAWCQLIPPRGCDCNGGCFESGKCSCVAKNGGEIPYNHNEAIVEAKPVVYECGPSCKCPPSCYNRVCQRGIKFQLQIFKTKSRGWGVRSLNSIPSGSFICEYAGVLLEDMEAEQRIGNDEYLFDIGNNSSDKFLRGGLSKSREVVQSGGFTIDAAGRGNVGRFINHSCSPNLYAQNVLYDHENKRMPHIMLFAAENIPPLQELTYHYNYKIDGVFDSDGNIKKKNCYCGSTECTGRMY